MLLFKHVEGIHDGLFYLGKMLVVIHIILYKLIILQVYMYLALYIIILFI